MVLAFHYHDQRNSQLIEELKTANGIRVKGARMLSEALKINNSLAILVLNGTNISTSKG